MTKIALCGNPNAGKTTVFNALSGMNLRVGNYNGATVSAFETDITKDTAICDLPGVFSLSPDTPDEISACEYLENYADRALVVVDGTSPENSAPIFTALREMKIPAAAVVTMSDILRRDGSSFDCEKAEKVLGIRVFMYEKIEKNQLKSFVLTSEYSVPSCENEEKLRSYLADCVKNRREAKLCALDRLLFGKHGNIAEFCLVIAVMLPIFLIYSVISPLISSFLEALVDFLRQIFLSYSGGMPYLFRRFVSDAVFGGAFSVVGFIPPVMLVYAYLTFLEESGIAPRLCVCFSPFTSAIGISSRAAIPFMLGFGCTVPAIDSLRAVDEESAKRASYVLPFFQCSAKFPVYSAFAGVFFGREFSLVILLIYACGVCFALVFGLLLRLLGRQNRICDVVELPRYRMPSFSSVMRSSGEKCADTVKKIATVLLLISAAAWVMNYVTFSDSKSLMQCVSGIVSPIFAPLGFGNDLSSASLIAGVFAKEGVLSSLSVFSGEGGVKYVLRELFSRASAVSFLTFFALYPPCVASITKMRSEFGTVHTVKCVMFQFAAAYVSSYFVYQILNYLAISLLR